MSAVSVPLFTPPSWLGRDAAPLSIELLDAAFDAALEETADLDFKLTPPAAADLSHSDLTEDIATMANSGGGMRVVVS